MLNQLEDLQTSNEELWDATMVSFTIRTREESSGELIEREYTFSYAKEWDKWVFYEYEERRCDDVDMVSRRNWRRTRNISWEDGESLPDVPPEVNDELKEMIGLEELNIETL